MFSFFSLFLFSHCYVSFMRGEGGNLVLFTALSPTPRTGDAVRHSEYLLNELNEGFASVFSLVLRISEPVIERKISIPSTHRYQRFFCLCFYLVGTTLLIFTFFIVQIFHQLHDCRCLLPGWLWWVQHRRSLPSSASLLISMTPTCSLQAAQLKLMLRPSLWPVPLEGIYLYQLQSQ